MVEETWLCVGYAGRMKLSFQGDLVCQWVVRGTYMKKKNSKFKLRVGVSSEKLVC